MNGWNHCKSPVFRAGEPAELENRQHEMDELVEGVREERSEPFNIVPISNNTEIVRIPYHKSVPLKIARISYDTKTARFPYNTKMAVFRMTR